MDLAHEYGSGEGKNIISEVSILVLMDLAHELGNVLLAIDAYRQFQSLF